MSSYITRLIPVRAELESESVTMYSTPYMLRVAPPTPKHQTLVVGVVAFKCHGVVWYSYGYTHTASIRGIEAMLTFRNSEQRVGKRFVAQLTQHGYMVPYW